MKFKYARSKLNSLSNFIYKLLHFTDGKLSINNLNTAIHFIL